MPSKDLIFDLIENIEKDYNTYIIGIIKKTPNDNEEKIEIYSNLKENSVDKLIKALKEYRKSLQPKLKNDTVIDIQKKDFEE